MQRLLQFWHELKRRKVIKVLAMYAGTAFILIEAVDIITPALLLPSWTVTLVIVLLAVGFPITVILSWIFDLTPEGIMKTESRKSAAKRKVAPNSTERNFRISDAVITLLLVAVVILLYPKIFKRDKFENIREDDGRISISVMPFQNLTSDTQYDVWQEGVQNLLINKLSNSKELSIRQSQTMFDILESTGQVNQASITPSVAGDIAQKLETSTFIMGNIMKAGAKVRISAQLRDAASQEVFKSYEVDVDAEDDFFNTVDSLSNLLKNYLEIEVIKQNVSHDFTSWAFTNSSEAYNYLIQGLTYYFDEEYESAIEVLSEATSIDTSFLAAYSWLLASYNMHGGGLQDYSQIEKAKQVLNRLMSWDMKNLSRIQQLSFNLITSEYIDKDPIEYIKNCKLILDYDPQQRVFWHSIGRMYEKLGQHENAIDAFERSFEISEQWGIKDLGLWMYLGLGGSYHRAGYHDKENDLYNSATEEIQGHYSILMKQAECALLRGDTTDANKYMAEYIPAYRNSGFKYGGTITHKLGHYYDRGHFKDRAEEYWRKAVKEEPWNYYHKRCFAEFLILNERDMEEGLELVNAILDKNPDYFDVLYFKGLALYKLGKPEEAYEVLTEGWDKRLTYRRDHYLAIKEVEKALASQNE